MSDVNTHNFPHIDILVVDDNTSDLKLLSGILRKAGYKVRSASDGELALRSVRARLPALILLDIEMPDLDGYEVCRRLKDAKDTRDIPVIFISVKTSPLDKVKAFGVGGVDYISKPFEPEEVLARVATHLALWEAQKEIEEKNLQLQQDITDRKRAEKTLRESEERIHIVVSNAPIVMWSLDKEGIFTLSEGFGLKTLGLKPGEIVGKSVFDVYRDVPKILEDNRRALAGESFISIVEVGELVYESHYSPLFDENGEVIGMIGVSTDITERKQAEESLRLHAAMMDNVAEGVYLIGLDDLLIKWTNEKFARMFGYDPGEIVGKHVDIVNAPTERTPTETRISIVDVLKETGEWHGEVRNIKRDGTHFWCYANVSLFDHPEYGKVIVSVHTDITERKKAEEELQASEEKLRLIEENTTDFISIIGLDGKYIYASPSYKLLGYGPDELIGSDGFELLHPEDRKRLLPMLKQVISGFFKGGTTERLEIRLRDKSGKYHDTESIAKLIKDDSGRFRILSVVRDITERKQAEYALKESETKYRLLAENTLDCVWKMDKDLQFTYINQSIFPMLGFTRGEWVGSTLAEHCSEKELHRFMNIVKDELRKEENYSSIFELNLFHKDGREIPLEIFGKILLDENKKVTGFQGNARDITERKQAEKTLIETELNFRALAQNAFDSIAINNEGGNYIYVNNRASELSGYSIKELLKLNIKDLTPTDDINKVANRSKKRIRGEPIENIFKAVLLRKDGKEIPIEVAATRTIWQGKPVDMVFFRDISEREFLEKQLRQAQKMEAIGQLAGGVAHDFNNLLTIILGYSQLTLGHIDKDTPIHKNIEKIATAGKQATTLTRQLLAFSRKQVLEPKVLNVNEVLTGVQKMLQRLIGEDIKLETNLDPNLKNIKVDPGRIEQVVMNLVINARDAMPDGGKITVKTENVVLDKELSRVIPESFPGRFVRFSVEDTGVGIDKAILNQIFEPFFSTKEVGVGTGLGLSVVYGIIKQHDGWVNVYSEPGQGSTFKVYLPAVSAKIEDEKEDEISLKDFKGSGERILLVEDEAGILEFAAENLRENGYVVLETASSKYALDIFKSEDGNFDLVFSDVVLPDKNGLQLVDELLSVKPELRVLLCSGYLNTKSQWPEIKKRGFRFLQKPYNIVDLLKTIREVLEQR